MTRLTPEQNFLLSRVYAKGWNTARSHAMGMGKAAVNPYAADPEKSRWTEGYDGALNYYRKGPKFISHRAGAAKPQ